MAGAITVAAAAGLGQTWSHNHAVVLQQDGAAGTAGSTARIFFGEGSVRAFSWDGTSGGWKAANSADSLTANETGLQYRRLDDDSIWQFDATGKLLTVTQRNGWITTYTYSIASTPVNIAPAADLLITVSNQFGRTLSFKYNAASQLASATPPDGQVTSYGYDGTAATARLTTVSYPGLTGGTVSKTYLYENVTFPQLLTGIIDEKGVRLASYAYDGQGRGISTQHAGGTDLHSISYGTGGTATVTDPLGTQRTYSYGTAKGKLAVTGADKPSGTGNSSAGSRVQDANGFVTQESDFLGVNTMYTWDINRRLPLTTTKAAGKSEAQTTTTQWQATYRLPVLVTEAGRTTAYTYDAQGNRLSQTVTDTNTSVSRTTNWTYNPQGSIATVTVPSGVVASTYAYYADTSFQSNSAAESFDPNMASVSLLLHGDGANGGTTFTDSSLFPKNISTVGNAKINTAQSKFGGAAIFFDGTGDYLGIPFDPALNLRDSSFTLEGFFHIAGPTPYQTLFDFRGTGAGSVGWGLAVDLPNKGVFIYDGTLPGTALHTGVNAFSAFNTWYHFALVRDGTTTKIYVDGVEKISAVYNVPPTHSSGIRVGLNNAGNDGVNGYLDDVRITKGVARYTANFTPPTQAFPNVGPAVIDPNAVGHTIGDLQSITNAAGHVTQYTQYDRAGRVRQMVDPKGVITDTVYTPRGWVSSVTVTPPGGAARTTSYTYDAAGQLTGASLPDSTTLGYSYDAAHRLVGVTDAKGNAVSYTLDAMGNRVGEQVKDPLGNLQRSITRVYDALNRVQQTTGASN